MLSMEAHGVLEKLRDLSPNLEKLLEHQKILVELFTTGNDRSINKNCAEINQKCHVYNEQFGHSSEGSAGDKQRGGYQQEEEMYEHT